MENSHINENSHRVIDLLEQINKVNEMIDLHKNKSKDNFMLNQYRDMKHRFLVELQEILAVFEIEILIGKVA